MKGTRYIVLLIACGACGCFGTREPEPPGQSGLDFEPATVPQIVFSNLKNSIAQKSVDNYMRNFSDPLVFNPSAEASSTFPNVRDWTYEAEEGYFRNLVAKANGFSSLILIPKDSIIGATETTYNYDYVFTFEHTDESFPTTAMGNLQFILEPDASNIWSIHDWSDFSTTPENITWSSFKGKFGN